MNNFKLIFGGGNAESSFSAGDNDTVDYSAPGTPPAKRRMCTEYTAGLDCSPVELIKEEPIKHWPSVIEPIHISSSPEPSPEKDSPISVELISINDNGDRDEPALQLNFCGQVKQYTFQVYSITRRTRDVRPLATTEERIAGLDELISGAKTKDRRKGLLVDRTKKLHELFLAELKANPRASRPAPKVNYVAREFIKEKNQEWRYDSHMIKYMGHMVKMQPPRQRLQGTCDPPETNETRECLYCLTEIDLCHWGTHIQGKYHKVNKIINNWLKCFCWYKNREIAYHHWGSCKECFHRLDESSNEDDPRFHKENEYNPEHHIEAKQAIALPQSPTNYVCTVCDVMCYSEEFYKKHLSGRKHRTYLSLINGDVDCSDGSTQKRKEQNKSQVQREKKK